MRHSLVAGAVCDCMYCTTQLPRYCVTWMTCLCVCSCNHTIEQSKSIRNVNQHKVIPFSYISITAHRHPFESINRRIGPHFAEYCQLTNKTVCKTVERRVNLFSGTLHLFMILIMEFVPFRYEFVDWTFCVCTTHAQPNLIRRVSVLSYWREREALQQRKQLKSLTALNSLHCIPDWVQKSFSYFSMGPQSIFVICDYVDFGSNNWCCEIRFARLYRTENWNSQPFVQ